MRTIYINNGGQKNKKMNGSKLKTLMFLFLFLVIVGAILKLTAPIIVEKWINQKGTGARGYAYSIREVGFSFGKGQLILKDMKIFNPKTKTELLEAPNLIISLNWTDLLLSQEKKVSVYADKIDLNLSKDFSSEMERVQALGENHKDALYLDAVEGKIGKLNIIERKEDQSRTVLELNDVDLKVKEVSLLSVNRKTEFTFSSNIADGGKLNLIGKTSKGKESVSWSVLGSLEHVPADIFNKMAGDKLPFSFNNSSLNAEISAHSDHGKVSGEISPDIKRLNLLDERPGIQTQSIARALSDELTFILPFTLKDELTFEYADTYRKLKTYRKYAASIERSGPVEAPVSRAAKTKKSYSFWPFF